MYIKKAIIILLIAIFSHVNATSDDVLKQINLQIINSSEAKIRVILACNAESVEYENAELNDDPIDIAKANNLVSDNPFMELHNNALSLVYSIEAGTNAVFNINAAPNTEYVPVLLCDEAIEEHGYIGVYFKIIPITATITPSINPITKAISLHTTITHS